MARTPTPLQTHLAALVLVLTLGFVQGCAGFHAEDPLDSFAELDLDVDQTLDHPTALGVLALVNDPAIDCEFLDEGLGLDSRVAERIVAHRQGADGYDGTADDDVFETIIELDAIAYLGEATLVTLGEAAWDLGYVPVLVVEGVGFSADESAATLLLVNHGTHDELDEGAKLDSRAADAIIGGRPYAGVHELSDRPYVGPAALDALRGYSTHWVDAGE